MSHLGLPMSDERPETRRSGHEHRRRERRRHIRGWLAVLVAVVVVGGILVGGYLGVRAIADRLGGLSPTIADDYPGPGGEVVTVEVAAGDSVRVIGERLVEADVVASLEAWLDAAAAEPKAEGIQPGQYDVQRQVPAATAMAVLVDPAQRQVARVTLPEGRRLALSLDALAKSTGLDRKALAAVAAKPAGLGLPAWGKGRLEGFVFPATYEFERDIDAKGALAATVARFNAEAKRLNLEAAAAKTGYTPYEILTIASLVEAEAPAEARAEVARVLYNRLADGMPLQLDSTVNYATGKTGITTSVEDRENDSPYNTYKVAGLPPGPINSPGADAIAAALAPAKGDALYFVTVNPDTGETKFARTFEDHQNNVAEFQDWLREQE